jgi:mTERF domain-containing protein
MRLRDRAPLALAASIVGLNAAWVVAFQQPRLIGAPVGGWRTKDGSYRPKWERTPMKVKESDSEEDDESGNALELLKTDDFVFSRVVRSKEKKDGDEVFFDFLSEVEEDDDAIDSTKGDEDNDDNLQDIDLASFPKICLDDLRFASTNVSYFYLQNELGLSEEAMWKITFEAGSVLGMTTATIRKKINVLRENMNLSDADLRRIIEQQPTILQLSADKNISPTILFLVRALDLGRDELRLLILASPSILSYKQSNLKSKIDFFTRLMDFSVAECRELLLSEPKLIRASVRTGLVPRMRFLVRDMDIPMDKLRIIVQKNPRIMLYSLDDNLIPKLIFYLIMTLSMDMKQIQKLLLSYPKILDYNLDRHTLPITRYIIQDLEVSPIEFRGILLKFPRLLTHSLSKIKHVVGYLRFEVGLTGSQVKRVLYQAPQVIGLNTDGTLKLKVEFLRHSFQLDDDQLRSVVAGMPTLLVLSIDRNLQPKTDYLRTAFSRSHPYNVDATTLQAAIVRLPTLLGYSLENRIRPRLQAILQAGLDPACITVGIPMNQEKFEGWLERRAKKAVPVLVQQQQQDLDPSGRILNWTRPRRGQ